MAWTTHFITLFDNCKHHLISSPLLLRYDSSKPAFLKTDWSAGGMGYILIQADDSPQSLKAVQILENTSDCLFDLSLDGPRLRPVFLISFKSTLRRTLSLLRWRGCLWTMCNKLL